MTPISTLLKKRAGGQGSAGGVQRQAGPRAVRASIACAGTFIVLAALIQSGLMAGTDVAAARVEDAGLAPLLDAWFPAVATLWSPEVSLVYGLVAAAACWKLGLGRWSAAPLGFLVLVPLEVALKLYVHRPPLPPVLKSWPSYLAVNPGLGDSFLNGSPARTGFFCILLAMVLWKLGGTWGRWAAAVALALALLTAFVRIYGRYHWLSNELASQLLGAAVALLVASPLANRLIEPRHRSGADAEPASG